MLVSYLPAYPDDYFRINPRSICDELAKVLVVRFVQLIFDDHSPTISVPCNDVRFK